jgi:hypothetical protein
LSDVWKEVEVDMKNKRNIRQFVKICCMVGIFVALDMNIDSWRTWMMIFSLSIAFDLAREAYVRSPLPPSPDFKKAEELLVSILKSSLGIAI